MTTRTVITLAVAFACLLAGTSRAAERDYSAHLRESKRVAAEVHATVAEIPELSVLTAEASVKLSDEATSDVIEFMNSHSTFSWFILPLLVEHTSVDLREVQGRLSSEGARYLLSVFARRSHVSNWTECTTETLQRAVSGAESAKYLQEDQILLRHAMFWGFDDLKKNSFDQVTPFLNSALSNPFLFTSRGQLRPERVIVTALIDSYGDQACDYLGEFLNQYPRVLARQDMMHRAWRDGDFSPLIGAILDRKCSHDRERLIGLLGDWKRSLDEYRDVPRTSELLEEYMHIAKEGSGMMGTRTPEFEKSQDRLHAAWVRDQLTVAVGLLQRQLEAGEQRAGSLPR